MNSLAFGRDRLNLEFAYVATAQSQPTAGAGISIAVLARTRMHRNEAMIHL
jgi:hypothetical protein